MLLHFPICPHCDKQVRRVLVDQVVIANQLVGGATWRGAAYLCAGCRAVLSVSLDPAAMRNEIVNEVVEKLKTEIARHAR